MAIGDDGRGSRWKHVAQPNKPSLISRSVLARRRSQHQSRHHLFQFLLSVSFSLVRSEMTRGNQRDLAREKNQKKLAAQKKPKESGSSLAKKKEQDAVALREKQLKKEQEKAAAGAAAK